MRNVFHIEPIGTVDSDIVRYGDKIRLVSFASNKKVTQIIIKIYLQSLAVSPMRSSKFSRHQEVSVTADLNSNTIWIIEHSNPKLRFDSVGSNV